uniref:Exocyst complex component putative n=1 Tax=Albugo laibachii Nc14 TaxID=890382 RepID=F0WGL2_9STRA|nr:exocyst complex component putative [Albugo laibachii Nc14]|eukprot:CCA20376.1 exocyst complex component putative [Albugo laibachii Nc14]
MSECVSPSKNEVFRTNHSKRTSFISNEFLETFLSQFSDPSENNASLYNADEMIDNLLCSAFQLDASNPTDFQSTFMTDLNTLIEKTMNQLLQYRKTNEERIRLHDNRDIASTLRKNLQQPENLLQDLCTKLEDLEERFTNVSLTAVLMGDRLAVLDNERLRVLHADEVMQALIVLNDPISRVSTSSNRMLQKLRDPSQIHQAAQIIRKLSEISADITSPILQPAVMEIERLSQCIENDLLEAFSQAQSEENQSQMRQCALSLVEYNDHEKVADRFVWNIMTSQLKTYLDIGSIAYTHFVICFCRLDSETCCVDPIQDLDALYNNIKCICQKQFQVIKCVFPTSTCSVISELLVERVFSDPVFGILAYVDHFLRVPQRSDDADAAEKRSEKAEYVQLLCRAYEKTCFLVAEIETIDSDCRTEEISKERMRPFLRVQLHSLFGNHRQRYFQSEIDLLEEEYTLAKAVIALPQPLTAKQKPSKTKHSSDITPSVSVAPSAATLSPEKGNVPVQFTDLAVRRFELLLFSLANESIHTLMEQLRLCVRRSAIILNEMELRNELITKLFVCYCTAFGEDVLGQIAILSVELLHDPLLTFDSGRQYLTILEQLLHRTNSIEDIFEELIKGSQAESPTQLTICFEHKRRILGKLEQRIAEGLHQLLSVIEKQSIQLLGTFQEKADFLGSESNASLTCSPACKRCVEYLQPIVSMISQVLWNENRDQFIFHLAASFKKLYLEHLMKFRFDPDGACMLLRDLAAYRGLFSSFRYRNIDQVFDVLHEIANLFALLPENIGGYVRDSKLVTFPKQELLELVKRRWDYKSNSEKIHL